MTDPTLATFPARSSIPLITAGAVVAAVLSIALNTAIAAIARAAGASADFAPLNFPIYTQWTVLGVLAGFAGWAVVRARAARPRPVLRVLVPSVVLISWIPDVILGFSSSMDGTSWGAAVALMLMHVVIAVAVVSICVRQLPLPR